MNSHITYRAFVVQTKHRNSHLAIIRTSTAFDIRLEQEQKLRTTPLEVKTLETTFTMSNGLDVCEYAPQKVGQ
jgi:hypothetical protein